MTKTFLTPFLFMLSFIVQGQMISTNGFRENPIKEKYLCKVDTLRVNDDSIFVLIKQFYNDTLEAEQEQFFLKTERVPHGRSVQYNLKGEKVSEGRYYYGSKEQGWKYYNNLSSGLPEGMHITNGMRGYELSDFSETKPPVSWSDDWVALNHSRNEFSVSIENGKLRINNASESPISFSELEIPSGKLKAVDQGEWGGKLYFISNDGNGTAQIIKEGNAKFLFRLNEKIYFLEGITHMSRSDGAMYRLDQVADSFQYVKIIDFEDAPEAFNISKGVLYVASHKNFYRIKNLKKELIFEDVFWNSLYPNSIAVMDERNIYMGIRSGYVKLDLPSQSLKFFKYK